MDEANRKACIMKNTYLYGISVLHSSHSTQSEAAECVGVRTDCAVVRHSVHWTSSQLEQIHDRTSPLVPAKCKDNLRAAGSLWEQQESVVFSGLQVHCSVVQKKLPEKQSASL